MSLTVTAPAVGFPAEPNPYLNFNPKTARWDANNALALARTSMLAYEDSATGVISAVARSWGFNICTVVPVVDDIQAIVLRSDAAVVVAFRGTMMTRDKNTELPDLSNWLSNVNVLQMPFSSFFGGPAVGQVHLGFAVALYGVWPALVNSLKSCQDRSQTFWFTGHSLGGALAMLAAAAVVFSLRQPVNGLYTFGQPRVGDLSFCTSCDSHLGGQYFRFVNNRDIVTRVPPRVLAALPLQQAATPLQPLAAAPVPLSYGHAGKVLFFDGEHVLHSDESWWNEFLLSEPVGMKLSVDSVQAPVTDHNIETGYIAGVQKYVNDLASGQRQPLAGMA